LVKIPAPLKIRVPLSKLQRAPCISSQAIILTKFRLTSLMKNFSSNNILHIPASKSESSTICQKIHFCLSSAISSIISIKTTTA